MSGLSERLRASSSTPESVDDLAASPTDTGPVAPGIGGLKPPHVSPSRSSDSDALNRFREEARLKLFERLGSRLSDPSLGEEEVRALAQRELAELVEAADLPLNAAERRRVIVALSDDVLGYGPLQAYLDDDDVTEVMVNGPSKVYIERDGKLERVKGEFSSEDHLRRVIERIVGRVGRRIDESSPLVDARLEDGSRVNAIIPPLAFSGSTLTIRKFGRHPLTINELINKHTLSMQLVTLLHAAVEAKLNILVSGGTGTGKTTLLNALSSFVPHDERIVTIEDAVELQLQQEHVVRLEARPRNIEGAGEVTIRDLVRNSLRMRPDRIIVGEVRGGESLDMLQAMNTGHEGSLSTLHANSPRDAVARLETMVLMSGLDLPLRAIREQISSAIDIIVHLGRLRDGTRRVTSVTEVQGMEGQVITLQDVYAFDYSAGVDESGKHQGATVPTGIRPQFTERMQDLGIALPRDLFGSASPW